MVNRSVKHNRKKHVLGLTGGVGAGKSTVLRMLEDKYGALVIEADRVAQELMSPGGACYGPLRTLLGDETFDENGELKRSLLAEKLFADPQLKERINSLVHPATFEEVKRRVEAARETLIVYEAALPAEARFRELCDKVIYVWASPEVRRERLQKGRGYSYEKSSSIMASQLDDQAFRAHADGELDNSGSPRETARALTRLMGLLRKRGF